MTCLSKFILPVNFFFYLLLNITSGAENKNEQILKLKIGFLRVRIESPSIIRITLSHGDSFSKKESLSVLRQDETAVWQKTDMTGLLLIRTDSLLVEISKENGTITFRDRQKKKILEAAPCTESSFVPAVVQGENVFNIRQNFLLSKEEALYGLGEFEDAVVNWRNHDVLLEQANRTDINPFLVSTNGYGLFWDNYSSSKFHDGEDGTYFWSQVADQIDYYFVSGSSIDRVISGYRKLTGNAPLFGRWAYGYWQSKERYMTGHELITVIGEYRKRNIPFDNIIQDWQYWGDSGYFSGMVWDKERFADPKAIVDTIHSLNSHIIASIWPAFGPKSEIYLEMARKGMLFNVPHWAGGKVYDTFNPEARDVYWKYLKSGLYDNGIDGYWMDGSEPEFRCTDDRYVTSESILQTQKNYLGTAARYLNAFPLMHTQGVYENQRKVSDRKRVFILTRSVFGGQQRNGAVLWSGDTFATWDDLRIQVAAGINVSMSGIPYWNSDIGGFIVDSRFPGGSANDSYRELYVRWFQFGAFCPMFRSHGTSTPREMWQFGDRGDWAYDALVKTDKLRYRLLPYIYSTAWRITNEGYSFIRPLSDDYSNDKKTFPIGTQFMFGSSLMIAPVMQPMFHFPQDRNIDLTTDRLFSPSGKEAGADLIIFNDPDFSRPVLKRKTDASGIAWFGCVPSEIDSSYSVRFEGKILSDNPGEYHFNLVTDGGIKFSVDDKVLSDDLQNDKNKTYTSSLNLEGNQKYNFKLEYKEPHKNSANLKITWTKPAAAGIKDDKSVGIYLPANNRWFDFWTGKEIEGGHSMKTSVPIDIIPVYVPAGSILPLGPDVQYASEKSDPVELRIYPGKDCFFDIYEDENDNYNYEKGAYSIIPVKWNEKKRELTIGDRQGRFPGMNQNHSFNVVIVKENHGAGLDSVSGADKSIEYSGKKVIVKL